MKPIVLTENQLVILLEIGTNKMISIHAQYDPVRRSPEEFTRIIIQNEWVCQSFMSYNQYIKKSPICLYTEHFRLQQSSKRMKWGWAERWGRDREHFLLSQRTGVPFRVPTGSQTPVCHSSFKIWCLLVVSVGMYMMHRHLCRQIARTHVSK